MQFTTETLPYIYQSERYSLAWGKEHHGFYVDPDGNRYDYKNPQDWKPYFKRHAYRMTANLLGTNYPITYKPEFRNLPLYSKDGERMLAEDGGFRLHEVDTVMPLESLWGYETSGAITPNDLFHNLATSTKSSPIFKRKVPVITKEIIDDLLSSLINDYGQIKHDSGQSSNSLYVYDAESGLYRRILLSCDGDIKIVNNSVYTNIIIEFFDRL